MYLMSSAEVYLVTCGTLRDDGRTVVDSLTINRLIYIMHSTHDIMSTATPVRRTVTDQRVADNGRRVHHTYFAMISSTCRIECG